MRMINQMMTDEEDDQTEREVDQVKSEIMQIIDQIQSKDALTILAQ